MIWYDISTEIICYFKKRGEGIVLIYSFQKYQISLWFKKYGLRIEKFLKMIIIFQTVEKILHFKWGRITSNSEIFICQLSIMLTYVISMSNFNDFVPHVPTPTKNTKHDDESTEHDLIAIKLESYQLKCWFCQLSGKPYPISLQHKL